MVICLEQGANDLQGPSDSTANISSLASLKSTMVVTFLVLAYQGCSGKEAIKRVFVYTNLQALYYCFTSTL